MAVWGQVIEGAGSLGAGLVNGLFNANQAKKNRAFQERMYQQQYKDSVDFWKMQQEYNLPSAVRQRYEDAGLNPLLLYSQGAAGGVATSAPQTPSQPSGSQASASFNNPFAGFGLMDAQRKNIESQTRTNETVQEKNIADAFKAYKEAANFEEQGKKARSETEFNIKSMESRLEQLNTQNRLNRTMSDLNEWKVDEIKKGLEVADKNIEYVQNQIENNTRMTDQQIEESKNRIKLAVKETASKIALMGAEQRKALADAWLARERARTESQVRDKIKEKYDNEIAKLIAEGDAQELENLFNSYAWEKLPNPGSPTWYYNRFMENVVQPFTGTLGNLLSGAIGGIVGATIKAK